MSQPSYLDYSKVLYRAIYSLLDRSIEPAQVVLRSPAIFARLYRIVNLFAFFIFTAWALGPMTYRLVSNWLTHNLTLAQADRTFYAVIVTFAAGFGYISLITTPIDQIRRYKRIHKLILTPYAMLIPPLWLLIIDMIINYLNEDPSHYSVWNVIQVYFIMVVGSTVLSGVVAFGLLAIVRRIPRILFMILSTTSDRPPLSIPSHEQLLSQSEGEVRQILRGCSPLTIRHIRTVIDARRDSNNQQIQVFALLGAGFGLVISTGVIKLEGLMYFLNAINHNMSQLFGETGSTIDGTMIQVLAVAILVMVAVFVYIYVDLAYRTTRVLEIISVLCTVLLDEATNFEHSHQSSINLLSTSKIVLPSTDMIQAVTASKQVNKIVGNGSRRS